jgi:hypothetical protein
MHHALATALQPQRGKWIVDDSQRADAKSHTASRSAPRTVLMADQAIDEPRTVDDAGAVQPVLHGAVRPAAAGAAPWRDLAAAVTSQVSDKNRRYIG